MTRTPQLIPDTEVRERAVTVQDERDRPARAAGVRINGDPESADPHGAVTVGSITDKTITLLDPAAGRWMHLFDRVALESNPEEKFALATLDPRKGTFVLSRPTNSGKAIWPPKSITPGSILLVWNHNRKAVK